MTMLCAASIDRTRMRVTIIGTGYVGLVTGACLAEVGNEVFCLDAEPEKIALLKEGMVQIHEPGLPELVARNRSARRLMFSTDVAACVSHGEIIFIAVGTPAAKDGSADLSQVLAAARSIGRHMDGFKAIVEKSTVPVATAERVVALIQSELDARSSDAQFSVLSNPEFLKEGAAVDDFMRPDRILIGCNDDEAGLRAAALMKQLYAPFNRNRERTFWMDVRSAEFSKYAANAMLAARISFMNEMANLADAVGVDIESVRHGIGSDPRIGYSFLYAGCGYGGSCFPKDVQALKRTAYEYGRELLIMEAVEQVNRRQKQVLGNKIVRRFGRDLSRRRFAVWGLAFKPNTDDMREAPSRVLIRQLLERGAVVALYDPVAMTAAQRALADDLADLPQAAERIAFADTPSDALREADALVIATEWKAFRSPDFEEMKRLMKAAVVFDGRNLFSPQDMAHNGFEYHGIGRSCGGQR
jgi:UDPglucose 6-dehydrogenase